MKNRKLFIFFTLALAFICFITLAEARPGGGHSYGGSSSGSSSSGDGLIEFLIFLIFEVVWDLLGILIGEENRNVLAVIFFIVIALWALIHNFIESVKRNKGLTVFTGKQQQSHITHEKKKVTWARSLSQKIEKMKDADPDFSKIILLDFVNALYHKYYSFYGKKDISLLSPFLRQETVRQAQNNSPEGAPVSINSGASPGPGKSGGNLGVNPRGILNTNNKAVSYSEIVTGNIEILDIYFDENAVRIAVFICANYTENSGSGPKRYNVEERWTFSRKKGVVSQPPDIMRNLSCPNCGGPASFSDTGKCSYCGTVISRGDMQWTVIKQEIISKEQYISLDPGSYTAEKGTELPTIYQSGLSARKAEMAASYSLESWEDFRDRFETEVVSQYFSNLYYAWSQNNLKKVRHLLTDRLYESWQFWIDNYRRQGWTNKLENLKINRIEITAIENDKIYEAVTVRIFASCWDYIIDNQGRFIGGSRNETRKFSEYWTFIRTVKAARKTGETPVQGCPNCGAPLENIGQAGICNACGSKISNGDFSWVLAAIVQDEVYHG